MTGKILSPNPYEPKPPRGIAKREPTYNGCRVRVTDHAADGIKGFTRNDYSRRQPFNADSTLQLVYASGGAWHLYDSNYQHVVELPGIVSGDAEPQWHHSDPNTLYFLPDSGVGMKVYSLDVTTKKSTVVGDLGSRLISLWPTAKAAWTRSEGSPSADNRYWCLQVESGTKILGMITWDLQTDSILGYLNLTKRPDHVSMTPSGDYCIVQAGGTTAYSRYLNASKVISNTGEHSDIGIDANGDDTFVSVDYNGDGSVFMVNVRTGVNTKLFTVYNHGTTTSTHFSCKAFNRPGWFVFGTHNENPVGSKEWLFHQVQVVQMAANPKIYHIANNHVFYNGYWTEPHAAPNRELTRIVWNSNWDINTDMDVDVYMVELPDGAIH